MASIETVRQVLREAGVRWQATKTWKASRDPEFTAKMTRVLALYDQSAAGQIPAGGRVICVDEFGPLNLQPRPGRGWFPSGRPVRQRATYHRRSSARCTPRVVGPVPRETPDVALPDLRGLSAHRLAHPHDGAASPYQPREPQYVSEPRRSPRTGPSPRPLAAAF